MVVSVTISTFSQIPEKMSYQAVVRNASGELVKSSPVGMKISILQGSESGTAVYVETHIKTTNVNGLVTLEIGGGTLVTGTFAGIDWSTGIYFLKTETDPTGGSNYTITGTNQILSVPYSLYAKTSKDAVKFYDATQSVIGNNSPIINTGTRNILIGKSSGTNNTTGAYNTFIGSEAGYTNTIGNKNIAIGWNALRENNEGSGNIAIGRNALMKNKVLIPGSLGNHGFGNIAIGEEAMRDAISFDNVAIGLSSLMSITEGTANTALGVHTMGNLVNGYSNTALGAAAMINSISGNNNIAIGRDAGNEIAGSANVFIGNESGRINHGSSNIFIGHLSGWGTTWQDVSNRLIIHNGANGVEIPLIYGEFDNSFLRINGTVNIRDVLKLTPKTTAPSNPSEGDVYYNSTTHKLMVFDGTSWMACW